MSKGEQQEMGWQVQVGTLGSKGQWRDFAFSLSEKGVTSVLSRGKASSYLSLTTTEWVIALTTSEGWKTIHSSKWSSPWPLGAKTGQIISMPILHIGEL